MVRAAYLDRLPHKGWAMRETRVPTLEDFVRYSGAHTRVLWREVGEQWVCPGCRRNKFAILRWTMRFPGTPAQFMDWMAPLHKHHDHSGPLGGALMPRFSTTIVCDQCNAADGRAKRKLGLPRNFSFSPTEIQAFITTAPHAPHQVDYDTARRIFETVGLAANPNLPGFFP